MKIEKERRARARLPLALGGGEEARAEGAAVQRVGLVGEQRLELLRVTAKQGKESGERSVECRVRRAECGVQSAECELAHSREVILSFLSRSRSMSSAIAIGLRFELTPIASPPPSSHFSITCTVRARTGFE